MADISFNHLATQLPTDAIYMDSEGVMAINIGLVMGQPGVQSSYEGLAEFMGKLLEACNKAQVAYNTEYGENLTTFPAGSFSTPIKAADGTFYSRRTFNVAVNVPLNMDETVAV